VAYIDHVSGKPKLIGGYVVSTPYDIPLYTTPQTKPLSDEEIHYAVKRWEMKYNYKHDADVHESLHEFARAIEERHGIK